MEVMADAEAVVLLEDVCVLLCTLIFGGKEIVVGDQRERRKEAKRKENVV